MSLTAVFHKFGAKDAVCSRRRKEAVDAVKDFFHHESEVGWIARGSGAFFFNKSDIIYSCWKN